MVCKLIFNKSDKTQQELSFDFDSATVKSKAIFCQVLISELLSIDSFASYFIRLDENSIDEMTMTLRHAFRTIVNGDNWPLFIQINPNTYLYKLFEFENMCLANLYLKFHFEKDVVCIESVEELFLIDERNEFE